jgi:DNA repair photolyase
MDSSNKAVKGRGAPINPVGRFEKLDIEAVPLEDWEMDEELRPLKTIFYKDTSKSLLSFNDSPDVGPGVMANPYRGCEHGCIYCFARPTHEYLGMSAGLDFESKIFVKQNAPELLRHELNKKSWEPQVIAFSGVTDCYQPVERKLELTRSCMKVLAEFRNPVAIITKNHLVTRDIDILQELATYNAICVNLSITTLNPELAKKMEPRTSRPAARLKAIETLTKAGIPVRVMTAPIIPGLTDHEIPDLLRSAADAGAQGAGYTMVRLSHGLRDLMTNWLDVNYPLKKSRVLGRIRDVRGGELNDTRFGVRMTGEGPYAEHIANLWKLHRKKNGLDKKLPSLSTAHFRRRPADGQGDLFG